MRDMADIVEDLVEASRNQAEIIKELLEKLEQLNINLKQYEHR